MNTIFKAKQWLVGLVIVMIVGSFFVPGIRNFFFDALFTLTRPVLMWGDASENSIYSFSDFFTSHVMLVKENALLKEENTKLRSYIFNYDLLQSENEQLRKSIVFAKSHTLELIGTRVIGSFFDPAGVSLVIDGGTADGIASGELALANGNVLVGRVSSVSSKASKIALIQNTNTTISVTIVRQSFRLATSSNAVLQKTQSIDGLFIGKGDTMIVDLVPNSADVRVGDLVITNGFGENAVRDLIVGEVSMADKNESEAFQDVHVKPILSYKNLSTIFITRHQ